MGKNSPSGHSRVVRQRMLGWKAKSRFKGGDERVTVYYDRSRDACTVQEDKTPKPAVTAASVKRISEILEASQIEDVQLKYQAAERVQVKEERIALKRIHKRRNGKAVSKSLLKGCNESTAGTNMLFKRRPALTKTPAPERAAAARPASTEPTMNETFFRRWGHNLSRWGDKDKSVGTTDRDADWWRSNLPSSDDFSVHTLDKSFDNRRSFASAPHSHPWDEKCGASCSDMHCIHRAGKQNQRGVRAATAAATLKQAASPLPQKYRKRDTSSKMYGLASRQAVLLSSKSRARLTADKVLNGA